MNPHTRKDSIRNAQAKHLSTLFGDDAPAPTAQQAAEQQRARAESLTQAAAQKEASLSPEETARLKELQRRQATANVTDTDEHKAQTTPSATPAPTRLRTSQGPPQSDLQRLSERNDLASAALQNMRAHVRQTRPPRPASATGAAPPPSTRPPSTASRPPSPSSGTRPQRPAPRPEDLEKMLKELAGRPRAGGRPERGESAAAFESPPEAPPETPPEDQPEYNEKKQAEIVERLRASESQAKQHTPHIPQVDQERAVEKAVEAAIPASPIKNNAVDSGEYYQALTALQQAMKVHDPVGQVEGINRVQQSDPNHPLSTQ